MQLGRFLLQDMPSVIVDLLDSTEHVNCELVEVLILFADQDGVQSSTSASSVDGESRVDLSHFVSILLQTTHNFVFLFDFELYAQEDGEDLAVESFE